MAPLALRSLQAFQGEALNILDIFQALFQTGTLDLDGGFTRPAVTVAGVQRQALRVQLSLH